MATCWTLTSEVLRMADNRTPAAERMNLVDEACGFVVQFKQGDGANSGVRTRANTLLLPIISSFPVAHEDVETPLAFARVAQEKFFLPMSRQENEKNRDEDLLLHIQGAQELSAGSFNNEWDPKSRSVVRLYHRIPPMLSTAEGEIEKQSLVNESRDQGLLLLADMDGEQIVRLRKGATLRLVFPNGEAQVSWRYKRPRFFGYQPRQ